MACAGGGTLNSASALLRMLVVDDEPAIQRFLRTSLAARGYRLIQAEDGEPALEALFRGCGPA